MIITVTLCPALEVVYQVEALLERQENDVQASQNWAKGEGLSASMLLQTLGVANRAMLFSGKETGRAIEYILESQQIEYETINVQAKTPIHTRIETKKGQIYTIKTEDDFFSQAEGDAFLAQFEKRVRVCDCVLLPATLPKGFTSNYIKQLMKIVHGNGALCAFDVCQTDLATWMGNPVFLMRMDKKTLEKHEKVEIQSIEQAAWLCKKIHAQGVNTLLLDMGGSWLYSTEKVACFWQGGGAQEKDAFSLAGFVGAMDMGLLPGDCVKMAAVCANISKEEILTGKIGRGDIQKEIQKIDLISI